MQTTLSSLSSDWLGRTWDYRPSAFWFWNAAIELDAMAAVVDEMARNGIREFLIHPVHGMETEYLSDEFFDCYRLALRMARDHGLKVWVYDDYSWPSGVAGGKLLREHPEHKGWYLEFRQDVHGGVIAEPVQSDRVMDNVMGAPWTGSEPGYVDTLSVEAMRCFIEMTHERILTECGDLFTEVIAGFFTDEPVTMLDRWNGTPGGWGTIGLPWTPSLPARFRERFGYNIEPLYTQLAGEEPSQARRDYWQIVKEMHSEAYHSQIGAWCREHGVKYTGHLGEDRLLAQVRFSGSIFQCLRHMDEPGIDFLGVRPEPEHRFIEQVVIPSIARHADRSRVYCEAFGVAPYDIRLGEMLRNGQMMGIHGINDIALMGFQHRLDGVRKCTYWPPIFREAPWWPFYSEFRDAWARSIGLTALGKRRPRYAVLYPQNQLEQIGPLFNDVWSETDPVSVVMKRLGLAIYAAGETFEFVFPEILSDAHVENGRIVLPHADYNALLAPGDLDYFDSSAAAMDQLSADGARVLRGTLTSIENEIASKSPSWVGVVSIDCNGQAGDIRVYSFEFADGELFALRNVTDESRSVSIASQMYLSEWDTVAGDVLNRSRRISVELNPHTCLWFAATDSPIGIDDRPQLSMIPMNASWTIKSERPNMARFSNIQFSTDGWEWLNTVTDELQSDPARRFDVIPIAMAGSTSVHMQAEFQCEAVPGSLGILFEQDHLESLSVNGIDVDLSGAIELPVWDSSCHWVDITGLVHPGTNTVHGMLRFQEWETQITNHAFFNWHPMPGCDVCVAGSFRLVDGVIVPDTGGHVSLPVDLSSAGWSQYDGILSLITTVDVDEKTTSSVRGIEVVPVSEDCIELLIDGISTGKRITGPYRFDIPSLASGRHTIEMRVTSTSANILAETSLWGINSACWLRH